MERHDTKMRAARYLLGAGTMAAALVAMTAGSTSAQTTICYPEYGEANSTVCGHVFTDANANGDWDSGEGVPAVLVAITDSSGNNLANSPTPTVETCADPVACGYYAFTVYPEVPTMTYDYWVCIITDPLEADCRDTEAHPEAVKITVGPGGQIVDLPLGSGEQNEEPPSGVWGSGTGTPGYWKNHPEAWPVEQITIGTTLPKMRTYTKQEAITILSKPVAGDKTYTIFASLVSAMLNIYDNVNNPTCISGDIAKAHQWFDVYGPVGSGVKAKSDAWVGGATNTMPAEPIHTKMDDYNNGLLCAPHRN